MTTTTTTFGHKAGEKLDARIDQLKDSVKGLVERGGQRASAIKTRGSALIERAEDMIKANPLKAVALAFGVGYFGTRLFRR